CVMTVRLWEAQLLSFDAEGQRTVFEWIAKRHPRDVGLGELYRSGDVTGYYLRWIVVAVLLPLFAWRFLRHPGRSLAFRQVHHIMSLARAQVAQYPMMAAALDINLLDFPLDHPVYGMRNLPRAYGRRHKMLRTMAEIPSEHPRDDLDVVDAKSVVVLSQCRAVFAKQIGVEWPGIGHAGLPSHERILLTAFAVQVAGLDDSYNKDTLRIIEELARSSIEALRKGDSTLVASPTADRMQEAVFASAPVQKILRRHGFRRTMLMGMLEEARQGGVLPSCWFTWLKPVDRVTWYALCDLGMHPSSIEAAGVRAQFQWEKAANAPVMTPMVEAAVNGFREYLDEVIDATVEK
ncbi:MAG: IcmP-like type IV secretion system protein, partial [Lysobacter sp.]